MKQTLENFKQRQAGTLKALRDLKSFLKQGEMLGINVEQGVKEKLDGAIRSVEDDKLRIVLVGGFSEGKTAIAAAWLERLDKSTMKISHQESSNALTVYEATPDCILIDTPGLFGFKGEFDAQSNTFKKYKEMTRKYVSEAHLVIYVMDPANPIKETHREELTWLFRTLNLLPRTVFVLGRFDEVADVEDDHEYKRHLAIKKENVVGRLRDLIAISEAEAGELAIIAVAADPFEMGIEHWLNDLNHFRAISRIPLLQHATSQKVAAAGGVATVLDEMKRSIVRDVLDKQLPLAVLNDNKIAQELDQIEKVSNQMKSEIHTVDMRIRDARTGLRSFVVGFFTDLILQAKGQSLETFQDFIERQIGANGAVLTANLQNAFDQQLRSVKLEVGKMAVGFDAEVDLFNATLRAYGKQGLGYVVKSGIINNTSVLAARDGVVGIAKAAGLDLSKMLKFNPWGAVKFANGLNGLLSALGLAIEFWDSWEQAQREQAFRNALGAMIKNFEKQREDLLDLINSPQFDEQFFPELIELRANVFSIEQSVVAGQKMRDDFRRWRGVGEAIDVDFRMMDTA